MDWIKIKCNFADHRKVRMIRRRPKGDTLALLWLLLLAEAGKCDRGGYLMISDSQPQTGDTLSMITGIPLPTVRLGLSLFVNMEMICMDEEAIFVKNWRKYQSSDKLDARRENDRIRQNRHRGNAPDKEQMLPDLDAASRDSHVSMSRDVTRQNRTEKIRKETTTDKIRLLLGETPLAQIFDHELEELEKRHGFHRLLQAADIAAETWRRNREDKHNPGGYLHSLCTSLVVPDWYVPFSDRLVKASELRRQEEERETEKAAGIAQEDEDTAARSTLWDSLSDEQREEYLQKAFADLPGGINPSPLAMEAIAKMLVWEEMQSRSHK